LYSDGNIDIGQQLDVTGDINTGQDMTVSGRGVSYGASNLTGDRFHIAFAWNSGSARLNCIIDNNASVRPFFVPSGYVSDRRLKEDIIDVTETTLEKIYSMKIYEFKYKKDIPFVHLAEKQSIGVMADELAELFPEHVDSPSSEEEYSTVIYVNTIPLLIAAVGDLNKRLKLLEQGA
jgi:hypothetical protein